MGERGVSARYLAASVAASIALQGCISAGAPVTQTVRVETPGCARASCDLSNDRGSWHLASTPGVVTLTSSAQPLQVSCRAEGLLPNSAGVASQARELSTGSAVAGGVAGGAAVGAAVGSAALTFIPVLGVIIVAAGVAGGAMAGQAVDSHNRALVYPDRVSVPMQCAAVPEVAASSGEAPPLGLRLRGASVPEAAAAGLGARGALLVVDVTAGGRAAEAGLRAGDWILRIDGQDIADPPSFEARWRAAAVGTSLVLGLWREGRTIELQLLHASAPGS